MYHTIIIEKEFFFKRLFWWLKQKSVRRDGYVNDRDNLSHQVNDEMQEYEGMMKKNKTEERDDWKRPLMDS